MVRGFPYLTLGLILGPLVAGLAGTLLPAFGYLPALGGQELSLAPWRDLFATPGVITTLRLTLTVGVAATVTALAVAALLSAVSFGTPWFRRLQAGVPPFLAAPHVAIAFGFAFLIAPSGWLMRLVSPWATGYARPPDWLIVHDTHGLSLTAGLVLKEVPFLLLVTAAAMNRAGLGQAYDLARTMGYDRVTAWFKVVFPQVYPLIRLPLLAVLAFSLSVVDVAIVLGPGTPPPLAPLLLQWFNDADLAYRFPASAGAILLFLLVAVAILAWLAAERLVAAWGRAWIRGGRRGRTGTIAPSLASGVAALVIGLPAAGLLAMAVWSVAGLWRYPSALPDRWTLATWQRHADGLLTTGWNSLSVAVVASLIAIILTLGCLENEKRNARSPTSRSLWLLFAPLLVPQIAFLFGTQVLLVLGRLDGSWPALVWIHLMFVLPYVFLVLADPFRRLDDRYVHTALCLGRSPGFIFFRVKLPLLLRPILAAAAVGFAVSIGQYLPTLFAGAGRFATLTTEAVSLSAGGDRRVIGVYVFVQMLLPFFAFWLAGLVPRWRYRNRLGLAVSR